MKVINKYVSSDGVEFYDREKCLKHEEFCHEIKLIMLPMGPRKEINENGSNYIQHDETTILNTRRNFLKICRNITDHHWVEDSIHEGLKIHFSWPYRILSEYLQGDPLRAAKRFLCIDSKFREWGQIYFADNPNREASKLEWKKQVIITNK